MSSQAANNLDHPAGLQLIVTGGYATNFGTPTGVNISAINTALGGQIILTDPGRPCRQRK